MIDSVQSNPIVSVVMPVHNGAKYLQAAVDSILNQSFRDFEFLIIDDGSTDKSASILADIVRLDARVRIITQPKTGITPSLNNGINVALGEFIARMDADDLAMPDRLEKQVAYLRNHTDCVLVGSQVLMIDPEGLPIRLKHSTTYEHDDIVTSLLDEGWPIVHPAVMVRADVLRRIGGYDEQYPVVQDHDLFLRLSEQGKMANLRDTLLHYRQHFNAISFAKAQLQGEMLGKIVGAARARRGLDVRVKPTDRALPDRSPLKMQAEWAWAALRAGYPTTARKHALAVLRLKPTKPSSWKLVVHAFVGR